MQLQGQIGRAAAFLLEKTSLRPDTALVLGSGLGDYGDGLEDLTAIPYSRIPDFPRPTVEGHQGTFLFGRRQGREVVVLRGRLHYYEGFSQQELTAPIRVLAAIGVKNLVLTNAAGGVNRSFSPGSLMLISDHINFSGANPLIGPNQGSFGPRFPDVSDLYTASLRRVIREKAAQAGIPLEEGVYMMFTGPNYETPAEVRMAGILGADAVGMSTVPEALVAGHCGMRVVGVSCITNMAAGVTAQALSHSEVVQTAARVGTQFQRLLDVILTAV